MTDLPFPIHPYADTYPYLTGREWDEFKSSIAEAGVEHPVTLTRERVLLDGRNRARACVELGIEIPVRFYDGDDEVGFIIRSNIHRRHETRDQLAMRAADAMPYYEVQAKARQGRRTDIVRDSAQSPEQELKSRERAAAEFGIKPHAVQDAKLVREHAPDLADMVRDGEMLLRDAVPQAREVKKQRQAQSKPELPIPAAKPVLITLRTHTGEAVDYPKPKGKPTFNQTTDDVDWAQWTWNPVTGCLHGCTYCYARDIATSSRTSAAFPAGFTPLFHHERLDAPVNTPIPARAAQDPRFGRVFVCSMADLFGEWVPRDWIDDVFHAANQAPDWTYLFLTKFPQRYKRTNLPPHSWFGTSVDTQKRVRTAEKAMTDLDVEVRWLSLEPLLEPLKFETPEVFDWVVIGAQTATQQEGRSVPAFAPEFAWVSDLYQQFTEAGVPVYLKANLVDDAPRMKRPKPMPRRRS